MEDLVTSFWQDRSVLVTGATGFVGSQLTARLAAAGANVVCLVRDATPDSEFYRSGVAQRVRIVRGDVCDYALCERALGEYEVESVVHLAAQAIVGVANRHPLATFEANVRGTYTLLEACRRAPKVGQVVAASSDKAYGPQTQLPYTESMPLCGTHPYDVSKSCADLIAQAYATTYGLNVAITRCGNFFGPGDLNWNRIVPGTVRSVIRGQRPEIRSDGRFVRDYLYVEDGAAAYMTLVEKLAENPNLAGEAFNFSYEAPLSVLEIVSKVLTAMGSDLAPVVKNEASGEIREQYLDASKARTMLGWRPRYQFDEGLARTVAWYRDFFRSVAFNHD